MVRAGRRSPKRCPAAGGASGRKLLDGDLQEGAVGDHSESGPAPAGFAARMGGSGTPEYPAADCGPLRENGTTIGFIGVDNPRTCIHDNTHVRVLASFLLARIRQDRNEHRYQVLLQHSNEDLLQSLQMGFWSIRRDPGKASRMIVNDTMEKVLEFEQSDTPVQRYSYWYDRIPEEEKNGGSGAGTNANRRYGGAGVFPLEPSPAWPGHPVLFRAGS